MQAQTTSSGYFRHEALLYSNLSEFIAGTVPFIRDGLAAGEPVLVVETPEKTRIIREALGQDADRIQFGNMTEVGANPARIIPAWTDFVNRHAASGNSLRGIGEPIWSARPADELAECQLHESLLNVAFGNGRPWFLLCPYSTAELNPAVIEEARRSHEFVAEGGVSRKSQGFRGIEASGAPFYAPLSAPAPAIGEIAIKSGNLRSARSLVAYQALAVGLSEKRASHLVTAVNEVATNSILHGGGTGKIRMWREANKLICEIADNGKFDRPLADRERPGSNPSSPRGLWLSNQLCDLVQIRTFPEGTIVRLHMRLEAKAIS